MEQGVIFVRDHEVSFPRASQMTSAEAELDPMGIGDIELNRARRTLKQTGHRVHLTPKEFELVQHLMSHAGRPISIRSHWLRFEGRDTV
jgi:DNA-binding response OmpR family regulator